MKPVVVLDTNGLYGRAPWNRSHVAALFALARAGEIRVVVPRVVVLELTRQWSEDLRKARTALDDLVGVLADAGAPVNAIALPAPSSTDYESHVLEVLADRGVEVWPVPEVSTGDLLARDLAARKPFSRAGKGFRDAVIWESIRELCTSLNAAASPVIFVTDNHTDFRQSPDGPLHPDLAADIPEHVRIEVVKTPDLAAAHTQIAPLILKRQVLDGKHDREAMDARVERALAELVGQGVMEALAVYIGHGLAAIPISTVLDAPEFEDIEPDLLTLSTVFTDLGSDGVAVSARVEADCTLAGYIDKTDYLTSDMTINVHEDWNRHVFRASENVRIAFVLTSIAASQYTEDFEFVVEGAEDA